MKIDWQYQTLFAFQAIHPDDEARQAFRILPTAACRRQLARYGLIFKPLPNGGVVIVEKKAPGAPGDAAQPVHKITGTTGFSFLLFLNDSSLLPDTVPFQESGLPSFIGRSRILYFDNLDSSNRIDHELDYPPQPGPSGIDYAVYELAREGEVGLRDLASLGPNDFEYYANPQNTSIFQVKPIHPNGGTTQSWPISNTSKRVSLKLEEGPYTVKQSNEEIFYAATPLMSAGAFGLIHIFKDQNLDYNLAIRYDIYFEKA